MDLVPCVHCQRHVSIIETTCPFCARGVPLQRARFAFAGKLTRAAIFSAAVVGCDSKGTTKPAPVPAQHEQGSGSDDLEKMLDHDPQVVDHPPAIDAAVADSGAVAVTTDASTDPSLADRKRAILKRHLDDHRKQRLEEQQIKVQGPPMPYGAPPARRRMV